MCEASAAAMRKIRAPSNLPCAAAGLTDTAAFRCNSFRIVLVFTITQSKLVPRNPWLNDEIPLGFSIYTLSLALSPNTMPWIYHSNFCQELTQLHAQIAIDVASQK